jgi:hypothetical protein
MSFIKKNKILEIFFYIFFILIFFNVASHPFFYGDDFTMLEFNTSNYFQSFITTDTWWRPFKNLFYNFLNQNYFFNAKVIILLKVLMHVSTYLVVYFFFKKIYKKTNPYILLIFLFHQTSVIAVYGIDTFCQQIMTFFGILSFINLYIYFNYGLNNKNIKLSLFFFSLCLLGKENGLSFLAINTIYILLNSEFNFLNKKFSKIKLTINKNKATILITYFSLITILYLFIRIYFGATWSPAISDQRYAIGSISSVPNILYYFFSVFNPIDNSLIFFSFQKGGYFIFFLIFSFLIFLYLIYFLSVQFSKIFIYIIILFVSGFPVFLLNHISELYTYHSIFFLVLIFQKIYSENLNNKKFKTLIITFLILSSVSFFVKTINIKSNFITSKKILDATVQVHKDYDKSTIFYLKNEQFINFSNILVNDFYSFIPRFTFRNYYDFDVYPLPQYESYYKTKLDYIKIVQTKINNKYKGLNSFLNSGVCFDYFKNEKFLKRVCKS